jgi:hypothetical protein
MLAPETSVILFVILKRSATVSTGWTSHPHQAGGLLRATDSELKHLEFALSLFTGQILTLGEGNLYQTEQES